MGLHSENLHGELDSLLNVISIIIIIVIVSFIVVIIITIIIVVIVIVNPTEITVLIYGSPIRYGVRAGALSTAEDPAGCRKKKKPISIV